MRHRKKIIKLNRSRTHRIALLKQLATSLFLYEQIETTVAKAKAVKPYAERLITCAKQDTPTARRSARVKLLHKNAVCKLFEVIGPKYSNRAGGYARITRTARREGDSAEKAVISLV